MLVIQDLFILFAHFVPLSSLLYIHQIVIGYPVFITLHYCVCMCHVYVLCGKWKQHGVTQKIAIGKVMRVFAF